MSNDLLKLIRSNCCLFRYPTFPTKLDMDLIFKGSHSSVRYIYKVDQVVICPDPGGGGKTASVQRTKAEKEESKKVIINLKFHKVSTKWICIVKKIFGL